MAEMTNRQSEILRAVVEQHAELSYPVGSVTLAKLFKVSSSTIRAEMNILEQYGYIYQPHTSAGRVPTDKGYRWYVNQLDSTDQDSQPIDKVKVFDVRVRAAGDDEQTIRSAIESLVDITNNAGLATLGRHLYTSGLRELFSQPEFVEPPAVQSVAYLIDNLEVWLRETTPQSAVSAFIGQENPIGKTSGCSLIIAGFKSPHSTNNYIGVIGSTRQDYRQTMALVEHAGHLLEDVLN